MLLPYAAIARDTEALRHWYAPAGSPEGLSSELVGHSPSLKGDVRALNAAALAWKMLQLATAQSTMSSTMCACSMTASWRISSRQPMG